MPSPYDQSPPEDEKECRERVDAMVREEPRRSEEVYAADGARAEQWHAHEDDTRRRREWEEEGRRRVTEQRRIEQDGIIRRQREAEQDGIVRRQREAEHAAHAVRLGPPTGQNQAVTIAPVAPPASVQYPSASSGPITGYLQMPLESPTRCVTPSLCMLSWYLKNWIQTTSRKVQ